MEIERKFLVNQSLWTPDPSHAVRYQQGYLSDRPGCVVRARIAGDAAFLTIKGPTAGIERIEMEYPIPVADARIVLDQLCLQPLIEKTRYREEYRGFVWEIDVFAGENDGLVVAEVELPSADTAVQLPPWVTREVSGDTRYSNSNLVRHPYSAWRATA